MNKRRNEILLEIVNEKYRSIVEYSKFFNVSEQTIKNDIKDINQTLKSKNQPTININDEGRLYTQKFLKVDESVIKTLVRESNFYTYKLSQNERKTILAVTLLSAESYMTIAALSEVVFMSRNTLINDLDELKTWFGENDLKLISQTRRGFLVYGSEENIRKGILKLLLINGDIFAYVDDRESNIFQMLLIQELDNNNILTSIEKTIKCMEEKNKVHLTDFSYRELVYYLLVVVNRCIKNKKLEEKPLDWENLNRSSKYNFATDIITDLSSQFKFSVSCQELACLIETLRSKSYIKNNGKSIDMIDIQILINEFIYKISDRLKINFYLDFYLYDLLIDHMRVAVRRLRQNHSLINPLLEQLLNDYGDVFDGVRENIKSLEDYVKHNFTLDEISFIVMYIVAVMEKNKIRDIVINTVLVCNTGRGTAQLIAAKLNSLSRLINITDIISSHSIEIIDNYKTDMVISTVPLKNIKIPYLQVNPMMSEEDLYGIQKLMSTIQDKKQKSSYKPKSEPVKPDDNSFVESLFGTDKTFRDILSEDRIELDIDAKDWKEAVTIAGEILYKKNAIEKRYINAMIKNIEKNGPYVVIYPGIAIPHADPTDGAIDAVASIVRLNKPVSFGHPQNDPVKYIIAISILDSDSISKPLYNLTKMLGSSTFIDDINKACTANELLKVMDKYEELIKGEAVYDRDNE